MGEPGFWDDPDTAAKVNAEYARVTRRRDDVRRARGGRRGLLELADEGDADEVEELAGRRRVAPGGARARAAVLRPLRRRRRAGHRQLRRGRHGRPGLGRDAPAHGDALGRAARLQGRAARGERGGGGRHQVGDLPRQRRERLRALRRREGRAPARAHLALRRPDRAARPRSRPSRCRPSSRTSARSRSTTTTCRSTPTARPAPAASTSTRRTPPCASPTGRPASSSSARTSARRRRTS